MAKSEAEIRKEVAEEIARRFDESAAMAAMAAMDERIASLFASDEAACIYWNAVQDVYRGGATFARLIGSKPPPGGGEGGSTQ